MFSDFATFILSYAGTYISIFIEETWWFLLFIVLFPAARSTWLYWRQLLFRAGNTCVLLELRIPREVTRGPRGMEQVLRALHTLRNSPDNIGEKYWDGEVTRWFSLELVSFGSEVHFYIRCPIKQRGLVEAAFFAYYPDVDIVESEDYMKRLPEDADELWANGYEFYGGELLLSKPGAYPIKTYLDFEVPDEDTQLVDPISSFLEVLGKIKREEFVVMQINIAPAGHEWVEEFEELVEKLQKRGASSGKAGDEGSEFTIKSPGQLKVVKAVEEKLARPAFETLIRIAYIAQKETYYDTFARKGIIGAFSQYGTLDMNGFRTNHKASTRTRIWDWPHIFPTSRRKIRQKRFYALLRERELPEEEWAGKLLSSHIFNWNNHSETIFLTTAELATIFHPPMHIVLTAPHIPRVESRKAGPPAGIPIYGDDSAIEKFT